MHQNSETARSLQVDAIFVLYQPNDVVRAVISLISDAGDFIIKRGALGRVIRIRNTGEVVVKFGKVTQNWVCERDVIEHTTGEVFDD